jgi:phospholipid/cholesterol/gamma-HCH transport system substrate-binding protein
MTNIRKVLSSEQTEDLGEIFSSLKNTMNNLERTSSELNGALTSNKGKLNAIFSNVESISVNLKNNNEALTNAIQNVSLITDSLAKLNLTTTLSKVNNALAGVNEITNEINAGHGSLGKLIKTDSLHTEVMSASHSLDLLLNDMRVNPKRYLSFSVIGRKSEEGELSKRELEQLRLEIDNYLKSKR